MQEVKMARGSAWMKTMMIVVLLVILGMHIECINGQNVTRHVAFVFGDSLVDPGNNNRLPLSLAKANFYPNGIDYPSGPTGRFCNGRTVPDVISQLLGVPAIPGYKDPKSKGSYILGGLNYASAAAGILNDTGSALGQRFPFDEQIRQYEDTQQSFKQQLGDEKAMDVLSKALYFVNMGGNDYLNNYLQITSTASRQYTPKQFEALLIREKSRQLTTLYNLGARKFGVVNVGPVGCIPNELSSRNSRDGKCIQFINDYVQGFNAALRQELSVLQATLPGSTFVYADAYGQIIDRVNNPSKYGLKVVNTGCCGLGNYRGTLPCPPSGVPCSNRSEYLFWDPFHATDVVNVQIANAFFTGGTDVISPMNVQQLADL